MFKICFLFTWNAHAKFRLRYISHIIVIHRGGKEETQERPVAREVSVAKRPWQATCWHMHMQRGPSIIHFGGGAVAAGRPMGGRQLHQCRWRPEKGLRLPIGLSPPILWGFTMLLIIIIGEVYRCAVFCCVVVWGWVGGGSDSLHHVAWESNGCLVTTIILSSGSL